MLLVIDIGNTNVVAGIYQEQKLLAHWRFSTDKTKTADEYGMLLLGMFFHAGVAKENIDAIIISTVVPPLLIPFCHMCERYFKLQPIIVDSTLKTGITFKYTNPKEIGADRIVNAVAAWEKYKSKGNLIIIDFGTATTFCALNAQGEYLGGAIAPGILTGAEALYQKAAKLPKIELVKPGKAICQSTVQAMQAGIIYGAIGQMDKLVAMLKEELGGEAFVIASGGFGKMMSEESTELDVVEPFLTLEGLRILYERNKE